MYESQPVFEKIAIFVPIAYGAEWSLYVILNSIVLHLLDNIISNLFVDLLIQPVFWTLTHFS